MTAVTDTLVQQLRVIKTAFKVVWSGNLADDDRITVIIAQFLEKNGTTSILDLRRYENAAADLAFFFDARTAFVYPSPLEIANGPGMPLTLTAQSVGGPVLKNLLTWTSLDSTNLAIYLVFTPDGYPVFLSHGTPQASDWVDFIHIVAFVAASVVGYAFPALGASIGTAVCGADAAAAYPAIVTALGNTCIQTALNGGNVQAAVTGQLTGAAGGAVGGAVASASDSAIIGRVAAAATSAAISGGDVTFAVAGSLLSSGVKASNVGGLLTNGGTMPRNQNLGDADIFANVGFGDPGGTQSGNIDWSTGVDWNAAPGAVDTSFPSVADLGNANTTGVYGASSYDFTTPVVLNQSNNAPGGPSGVVSNTGGIDLTQLALTGLKLVQAWNTAGKPTPRVGTSTAQPNANGTLTQIVNGRAVTAQMPAGQPYLLPNGSLVTNNGDGTFTTVSTNGTITRQQYSNSGLTSLTSNPMMLAGVALLAVLLLKKGR